MQYMMEFMLNRMFGFLDEYKTFLGGLVVFLTGLIGLIGHYYPDLGAPTMEVSDAVQRIGEGLAIWGIGHKFMKSKTPPVNPSAP